MTKLGAGLLLAAISFAITACAGTGRQTPANTVPKSQKPAYQAHPSAPRSFRVVRTPAIRMSLLRGHGAAFLSPTRLAFLTSGSSNCPAIPATPSVETPHAIRIRLKDKIPSSGICLTDLVIKPVVIAIDPNQVNVHHRMTIRLYYPHTNRPVVFTAPPR